MPGPFLRAWDCCVCDWDHRRHRAVIQIREFTADVNQKKRCVFEFNPFFVVIDPLAAHALRRYRGNCLHSG